MEAIVKGLISEMERMRVIDTHEHLPPEEELVSSEADIFTRIFSHYVVTNLNSAGFKEDRSWLMDTRIPLEQRWESFRPYLNAIRDTGYARAALIAAKELFGVEDINDDTYLLLSRRIREANRPRLYDRILKEKCRIEKVLNQGSWSDGEKGYSIPVYRGFMPLFHLNNSTFKALYDELKAHYGGDFRDGREFMSFWLDRVYKSGNAGIKIYASLKPDCIDDASAQSIFRKFLSGSAENEELRALGVWLLHKAIEGAPVYNLVVAVHCGLNWCNWEDFKQFNPMNMVPVLLKYRNTVFDLYHGGIPWVREMAVIGNQYPNTCLNLVWCHQISPSMTEQMLNEWLDLVPSNKIIAFGGDSSDGPEKTYGALRLAQENIARALAVRIARKEMSEERAVDLCSAWLYDNPARIYNLSS